MGDIDLASLPEKPEGWTRKMLMHMNFGSDGGLGVYDVFDPEGRKAPFCYKYDTRKGGTTGFFCSNADGVMTWAELRDHYAALTDGGRDG